MSKSDFTREQYWMIALALGVGVLVAVGVPVAMLLL